MTVIAYTVEPEGNPFTGQLLDSTDVAVHFGAAGQPAPATTLDLMLPVP